MNLKQIVRTAILGLGLNYCATTTHNYQGQPLTTIEQNQYDTLQDKVSQLRSVSATEAEKAREDKFNARTVEDFYDAAAREFIFNMFEAEKSGNSGHILNRRTGLGLKALSLELENTEAINRFVHSAHPREYRLQGHFVSSCQGAGLVEDKLKQYGIEMEQLRYPFPLEDVSRALSEINKALGPCKQYQNRR